MRLASVFTPYKMLKLLYHKYFGGFENFRFGHNLNRRKPNRFPLKIEHTKLVS